MASLAIPPVGRTWIPFVPRPLYLSVHGYDWAPFVDYKRPAMSMSAHVRLFGVGVDWQWNEAVRFYMLSLGAHWLVNLAVGFKGATPEDFQKQAGGLAPRTVWKSNRFLELALFGFKLDWGQDEGEPWRLRYFFGHRRIFHKRGRNADRQG